MTDKTNRKNLVESLISSHRIHTQEELVGELNKKGVAVTQATLSRDLKEIGAVKTSDPVHGICYSIPSAPVRRHSAVTVESVEVSGQICVLKCKPGFAPVVASEIDKAGFEGVMGSIAGDDTVFAALSKHTSEESVRSALKSYFNVSEITVRTAVKEDTRYAEAIVEEIYVSSQERKTGIARRTPEYICEKILAGKAVIAVTETGEFAGFSYIESWGGKSFVANSGLIVAHRFRGLGIARRIKEQTFRLSRKLFPQAKIFSITTGAAVMKMNYEFGFRPVPFSELTDDPEFWKGCEGCRHFDILKSHNYTMCICTGLLYDPKEHLAIHHPDEQ